MTAITVERAGIGRWWSSGVTSITETFRSRNASKWSTLAQGTPRRSEYESVNDNLDIKDMVRQTLPMGVDVSYFDWLSNLPDSMVEATAAASQSLIEAVEAITMSIARAEPSEPHFSVARNETIPPFALSVEPVLLTLTYTEPHFNWSEEVEIDPLDDMD